MLLASIRSSVPRAGESHAIRRFESHAARFVDFLRMFFVDFGVKHVFGAFFAELGGFLGGSFLARGIPMHDLCKLPLIR